jgi:hypothetical protein
MRTLVAAACCALLSLSQQAIAQEAATRTYSQKTLLKNWALSRCLAKVFTDTATQDDANATAGAYLEFGKQPIEAYEAINRLIDQFAMRSYSGSVKSSFNTMKCIDLFHSAELERLASKFSKTSSPR